MAELEDDEEPLDPFEVTITGEIDFRGDRVVIWRGGSRMGEVPLLDFMEVRKYQGESCLACKLGSLEDLGVDQTLRLGLACGRCGRIHLFAGGELCLWT